MFCRGNGPKRATKLPRFLHRPSGAWRGGQELCQFSRRPLTSPRMSSSFGRRLVDANINLSRATQQALGLPTDKTLWQRFEQEVGRGIRSLPDGATVVDVGGGRRCVYHGSLRPEVTLVAVDVSADELALNEHADRVVVADVSESLPLEAGSVDLLVSRAVLEHVPDVRAAARNMARVLKPGGRTGHLLPCRYSLFGMAARILPFGPLKWVLHKVMPKTIDQVEFDVHYDQGTPAGIERAFRDAGLVDVDVDVTWAQPEYFEFAFPVFLMYSLYEAVVRKLRVRSLAAYMVVWARIP
jgi:ubiquinone/menaquinone biosynthesis C-methylase UbiE